MRCYSRTTARQHAEADDRDTHDGRTAQTLVEYALILTLMVIIALLVALSVIGESTTESFNEAANALEASA